MITDVIAVKENESLKNLFKIFDEAGILGAPVIDDSKFVIGVVTETDLIKHFTTMESPSSINLLGGIVYLDDITDFNEHLKDHCAETVKDIMPDEAVTINEDDTLLDAINLMSENHVSRLPVVNKKTELVGIITRTDVMHQLAKIKKI